MQPVNSGQLIPGTFPTHNNFEILVASNAGVHVNGFLGNPKFLGFSLQLGDGIHYGWVEFNISQPGGAGTAYAVTVVAAAYETTPGQALAAGATTDNPGPSDTPVPNSLWLMALRAAGMGGLELLRRRRTA